MDIDELQSVQSRERQTDSLQQLRDSFYTDASEFIRQLREHRDRAAERADDPYGDPEVRRLSDEIETAEQTVEAIYDRRIGKIVKKASLAAADMSTDEDGLTAEERALFESLVDDIVDNREHVLDMIDGAVTPDDGGATASGSESERGDPHPHPGERDSGPRGDERDPAPPPADQSRDAEESVSAADLMSGDGNGPGDPPPEGRDRVPSDRSPEATGDTVAGDPDGETDEPREPAAEDVTRIDRTTVQITRDVGEILGVDQRAYDLSADDVVTLPEANAGPLLERDAAEKLE